MHLFELASLWHPVGAVQPFHKVLVATDFSRGASAALDEALAVRQVIGCSLEVLHVFEAPIAYGELGMAPPDLVDRLAHAADRQLSLVVTEAKRQAKALGTDDATITGEVVPGFAMEAIVDFAARGRFDLVIVGKQGRSALAELLIGSVAERVLRSAPCPVLTVPAATRPRGRRDGSR